MFGELMAVTGIIETNRLANGYRVPPSGVQS